MLVLVHKYLDIDSTQILLQAMSILGTWNGNEVLPSSHDPDEDRLSKCTVFPGGEIFEDLDQVQILGEVLRAKSRKLPTVVFLFEVVQGFISSSQRILCRGEHR